MTEESILQRIQQSSDVKNLSAQELQTLSDEIRMEIIRTVSRNGGHLASNLGVVELTVALHSVFNFPKDQIVWDVGHQSYAHKILTGRSGQIDTIRCEGGLSGFPKREESEYDSFNTGHSSTSISAALGLSCAGSICGDKHYTIAVIGDGALSGGLALEGMNNAGRSKEKLIVILNDNKMSISKNVGSMARYLTKIRMKPSYINAKQSVHQKLDRSPAIGQPVARWISRVKAWIRVNFFGHQKNIFEQMGFNYYGPLDGHDISQLQTALRAAKRSRGPVWLHICTVKGKGYEFAERDPKIFHGVSAFDLDTGEPKSGSVGYSDVFGECMCELARKEKRLCAITAAMTIGTGLTGFEAKYRNRFYDVGIAEEHAVTFAAGLAAGGAVPVFAVYSTFLQRSYDQILHDAALQNLHLVLAIDRAGVVGEDGETHQGLFDVAFLNTIPRVTIFAPSSFEELRLMLSRAVLETPGVVAVRYPRGGEAYLPEDYTVRREEYTLYGDPNASVLLITYGRLFSQACLAQEALREKGLPVCILKLNCIKPIPEEAIRTASGYAGCYFIEEGMKNGGVGESFFFRLAQIGFGGSFHLRAVEEYVRQAKVDSALHHLGLDADSIARTILEQENGQGTEKQG